MRTRSISAVRVAKSSVVRIGLFSSKLKIKGLPLSECFLPVVEGMCWVCHM